MREVIRVIAARLRDFVADRRSAKRFKVHLPCTVGLISNFPGAEGARRNAALEGQTGDVSASGLCLMMPAVHIGGHYLTGSGTTLMILLELPDGPILLDATAMRHERVDQTQSQMNFLIGVRIKDMSKQDRDRFVNFVREL